MPQSPEQMGKMPKGELGDTEVEQDETPQETEKTVNYDRKTIEVTPEIKVTCRGHVTEAESGQESSTDSIYLVTKHGKELIDSSSSFIDLKDAKLVGDEVVIAYTKLEKHYEEKEKDPEKHSYGTPNRWTEEVEVSQEYEKRIALHQ